MLGERRYHAVVFDMDHSEAQRTQFLSRVCEGFPDVAVVVVTEPGSLRWGMLAMISGASAYVLKPLQRDNASSGLEWALRKKRLESAVLGCSNVSD
jgi:DNA-binding NtrC family response regulator